MAKRELLAAKCVQNSMYVFSKSNSITEEPDVYVPGLKLQVVSQYKYIGILIDSKLTFKTQIKKLCKQVKFNLYNSRFTKDYMSLESAKMYMHSMVISHNLLFNNPVLGTFSDSKIIRVLIQVLIQMYT